MILVTGGAGFIGANLVSALTSQTADAVAVCDSFGTGDKWRNLRSSRIDRVVFPEEIGDFLRESGHTLSSVVHLGAISATTETDVDLIVRTNVQLSRRLWDHCAHAQIPFIYASSAATYGDGTLGFVDRADDDYLRQLRPLNAYGWSKHVFDRQVIEAVARREPCPPCWAGLKFFNVYGPRERHKGSMRSVVSTHFETLRSGHPLRLFESDREDYPDGGQMRDFVFVSDCVRLILWMLDNDFPSDIYNVGSGKARTWNELGHAMFSALNLAPNIEFVAMPEQLRGKYQYFTEADMSKLAATNAPVPSTSLEDGVSQTYRYMESALE